MEPHIILILHLFNILLCFACGGSSSRLS